MSAAESPESGVRNARTEFVRETTHGEYVSNPAWELFSDRVREFTPDFGGGVEGARGRGDPDPDAAFAGTEDSSLTLVYDLQQKSGTGNTFHDGSANPNDAATDFIERDSDNRILNTHTVVDRIEQSDLDAGNTVSGATSRDTRQYVVALGARGEVTITSDPSDGLPVQVELEYGAIEKLRRYQIDQPTTSEEPIELWVESTDNGDTSQTLTVQGTDTNDANQEEDISLNGTTQVQSTNTYKTVDAPELDSETAGDVNVYVDDGSGTSAGDQISVLRGQNYYDHSEGDLGVSALGSGSHASAIGESYELPHSVSLERPDGTDLAANAHWEATEFAVANNYASDPQGGTPRPDISAGDREATVDTTVWGETEAVTRTTEHLGTVTDNVRMVFSGGHLQTDSAFESEVGEDGYNASAAKSMVDVTYTGTGVTVSA